MKIYNWFLARLCWLNISYVGWGTSSGIKFKYLSSNDFFWSEITFISFDITSFFIKNYSSFFLYLPAAYILYLYYLINFYYHCKIYYFKFYIFKFNSSIFNIFYLISFFVLLIYWSFLNIYFFDWIRAISAPFLSPFAATSWEFMYLL